MNLMPMFTTTTVMMLSAGASFAGGAIVPVVATGCGTLTGRSNLG